MSNVKMSNVKMSNVKMSNVKMSNVKMLNVKMSNVKMSNVKLSKFNFKNVDITYVPTLTFAGYHLTRGGLPNPCGVLSGNGQMKLTF
jgi:uncharacterized protein YjbI with pentapeptide repeats